METAEISNRDKRVEIILSGLIVICLDTNMWLFFEYIENPNQRVTLLKPD